MTCIICLSHATEDFLHNVYKSVLGVKQLNLETNFPLPVRKKNGPSSAYSSEVETFTARCKVILFRLMSELMGFFLLLHPFWSLKQYRIILIGFQCRGDFGLDQGKDPSHPCLSANIDLQPKCVCHFIPAYFCSDIKDLCRQH